MAKLDAAKRNNLPKSDFGIPSERKYPMPDASHARNAKARASQAVNAGRMSKAEEARIDAKADKKLGKSKPKNANAARTKKPAARGRSGNGGKIDHAREALRLDLAADRLRTRSEHHRNMAMKQALDNGTLQINDYGSAIAPPPTGVVKVKRSL